MIGNPKSFPYFEGHEGTVSLLVVMESYFTLLRDFSEDKAEEALKMLFPLVTIPSKNLIRRSMKFRLQNQKRGLSYADALGYIYAKEYNMPFLTTDSAFKGLPNVIFLK